MIVLSILWRCHCVPFGSYESTSASCVVVSNQWSLMDNPAYRQKKNRIRHVAAESDVTMYLCAAPGRPRPPSHMVWLSFEKKEKRKQVFNHKILNK